MRQEHAQLDASPIVEAVCEVRFAQEARWDWTVPGLLAPALEADFPIRKEVAPRLITFGNVPGKDVQPPPQRFQFLSGDELSMVQSGPRMLAVNRLAPYPGWDVFVSQILRALDLHVEKCGWQPMERIGLLYINRILTSEPVQDVLAVAPRSEVLPDGVSLAKFVQQWELAFDHSGVTLTTTKVADPQGYAIQIDAFTVAQERMTDREAVVAWLTHAHEIAYQVFEKSLTERAFERLKG